MQPWMKLALLPLAIAAPKSFDFTQFAPAGPGDVRSPCPALNALANHNMLPHDGKSVTLAILQTVLPGALNVDKSIATTLYQGAVQLGVEMNEDGSLDLDALNKHNAIEHDGSLSRADATTGDNHSFNSTIFKSYMKFYDGMDNATPGVAGKARLARIKTEQARDPNFTYTPKTQIISNGETGLLLGVLGNIDSGITPVDYIKVFFEQERFPFNEGWRPSTKNINFINLNILLGKIILASGEALEDGLTVAQATLDGALRGLFGN